MAKCLTLDLCSGNDRKTENLVLVVKRCTNLLNKTGAEVVFYTGGSGFVFSSRSISDPTAFFYAYESSVDIP